ncbi:MAG: hypothetical protein HC788_04365 [Sphingopyxis sp.]|nr:hypothetical protein [Sphingopyxis sp.]
MTKFSLSSAWDDAVQLMRWEPALTLPIVGMLVLLPALVFALLGPVPTEPPTGADFATVAETLRRIFRAPRRCCCWLLFCPPSLR